MTIKEKLKSMKSSKDYPERRIVNFQGIDFEISPLDYIAIYSTQYDYSHNKPLIRTTLCTARTINLSLLDYEFDYFTLERLHTLGSYIDLVFVIKYNYEDNTKFNMKARYN